MKKQLLIKTDKNTLELLKSEAEKNLINIHSIEDVITNKSSNLLKMVISFFIITTGYSIRAFSLSQFDYLFSFSISLSILFIVIISLLIFIIFPKDTVSLGSEPIKNINENFIKGDKFDECRILCNKIENLQTAIEGSLSSYRIRLNAYKKTTTTLILGLILIFCSISLFYLFLNVYLCQ